jgi:hypothetical protein
VPKDNNDNNNNNNSNNNNNNGRDLNAEVDEMLRNMNFFQAGVPAAANGARRRVTQLPQRSLAALGSMRDAVTSYMRTSGSSSSSSSSSSNRRASANRGNNFYRAGGLPFMPSMPSNRAAAAAAAASPFGMGRFMRFGPR